METIKRSGSHRSASMMTASRDRSKIGRGESFFTTLLSFVLCSLLYAHEIPARQG